MDCTTKFHEMRAEDLSNACRSVTARVLWYACQPCSTLPLSYRSVNAAVPQYEYQSWRSVSGLTLRHGFG